MSLNGYMRSPVGFGAYGEEYLPEVEITDALSPLPSGQSASWVTPSQFSGVKTWWATAKSAVIGVGAGVLAGLAAEQLDHIIKLENPAAEALISAILVPATASITTIVVYGIF